jgi:hypothetical protein
LTAEVQSPDDAHPDLAQQALESIRAANAARTAASSDKEAWRTERDRLEALLEVMNNEAQRLGQENAEAEKARLTADTEVKRLDADVSLAHAQHTLADTATLVHARLAQLAATLPPGAVVVPPAPGTDLDEGIHALTMSERAAATLSIEVVPGQIEGHDVAVKLLRVSGAAAWWLAMDERHAGMAAMVNGHLTLTETSDGKAIEAIRRAITITEGRQSGGIVLLPLPETGTAGSHP